MNKALWGGMVLLSMIATAAPQPKGSTLREGEFAVASTMLGTQVTYENGTWNGGIPLTNLVLEGTGWGPIINPPMTGTYHVKLVVPVDIQGIALWQHKRPGQMQQIRSVDVFVDGKLVREAVDIPRDKTQTEYRIDVNGVTGQDIALRVRSLYDREGKEANWGGLDRVRVFSRTDVSAMMSAPDAYRVKREEATVPQTAVWTVPKTYTVVKNVTGNPCLQWDAGELAGMRQELSANSVMQQQLEQARRQIAGLLTSPIGLPEADKNADGAFVHVSDQKKMADGRTWGKVHNDAAVNCLTAAMIGCLTQEERYFQLAKSILMDYVRVYPTYQIGARPGFSHDPAKVFDQCLSDATWLIPLVRAYDLIYDKFTAEERTALEDKVLKDAARLQARNRSHLQSNTNWAVICTASILLTGYATHDETLVDIAEHGWTDAKGKRSGGYPHQFKTGIGDDMLWKEGAMGYQGMALQGLVTMAETLRHHGINMYAANDGALKKLFDSELIFSYPNFIAPAIHDSGAVSIFNWNDTVWEYAYDNYRDARYLPILKGITRWMPTRFQIFVSTTKYHTPETTAVTAEPVGSVNFSSVGYAVLRQNGGDPFLLLDYGPHGSHSHPDKLNIDLFANGEQIAADPGSTWYEKREYKEWFRHSFAHNLLIVDEQGQIPCQGELLVFEGDAQCQRARAVCDKAASGVTQDRAVFLTPQYLVDVFGAFSRMEHTYDLVYHLRGEATWPNGFQPFAGKLTGDGYRVLTDVKRLQTAEAFAASFVSRGQTFSRLEANRMVSFACGQPGTVTRLLVPSGTDTAYVTGLGLQDSDKPNTMFQRRRAKNTIFCTVIDFSGKGYVKSVQVQGGLEAGEARVRLETVDGVREYSVSYVSPKMTASH